MSRRISPVIPGFGLTLGYTLVYLSLLVLIPLGAMFLKTTQLSWDQFWTIITAPRVIAALNQVGVATTVTTPVLIAILATVAGVIIVIRSAPPPATPAVEPET